jgi:mannose-6-phosphate isomerase-like protein (cupin superfamily)
METASITGSPVNHRGGQSAYLLLAKGQFGAEHVAVTWVDCPAGSEQPLHMHAGLEQVYVIVRGRGTMTVGGERAEVGEGTLVFVPPETDHAIRNDGPELLTYVSATSPPFDPPELGSPFIWSARPSG